MTGVQTCALPIFDPLVAVMISVFVLGESMSAAQIVGGVLILGFTLWNEIGHKQ